MASLSIFCILSPCYCCSSWAPSAQAVSTSLMESAHLASASWIVAVHTASASQVTSAQWALATLMASAVMALFWWRVVSVSDTSLLQWASIEALVVNSHPMAVFISPCSQSTSSDKAPDLAPRWVSDCSIVGTPAASGVSDVGVREGKWLIRMVSSIVTTCSDACVEVAIGSGLAKSALSLLRESSDLISGGAPRVADVDLFRVVCPGTRLEVLNTALDSSSLALEAQLPCWDTLWQNVERKVVLRPYGEPGQWALDLPALCWRGPPVIEKVHGWVHRGCPCPRQVVPGAKTVWVLNPHLGLWGTLPEFPHCRNLHTSS